MKRKRTITIEIEREVTITQRERTVIFHCAVCGAANAAATVNHDTDSPGHHFNTPSLIHQPPSEAAGKVEETLARVG